MSKKKNKKINTVPEKNYTDFPHIVKEVTALKNFCNEMGYTYDARYYINCDTDKRCYIFEINETSDSEGNPYSWAWSMVTGYNIN